MILLCLTHHFPIQRNVTPDSDQGEENNRIEFNVEDDSHEKELPRNAVNKLRAHGTYSAVMRENSLG